MDSYSQRFGGIGRLYSPEALEIFKTCHICVVGIGGVGSWAVEALARSGIGKITMIDLDDLCITNINRQLPALNSTIGKPKAQVMANRINEINPHCIVNIIDDFLSPLNLSQYLNSDFGYVIDAIDQVPTKVAMINYCKRLKIKLITIGGAGGKTDPTQIQVADLSQAYQDPLLAKVRSLLRKNHGFPNASASNHTSPKFKIECVFSTQPLIFPKIQGNCQMSATMNCANGFGASTMVTASFALVAVARILDKIVKLHNLKEQ